MISLTEAFLARGKIEVYPALKSTLLVNELPEFRKAIASVVPKTKVCSTLTKGTKPTSVRGGGRSK